MPSATASASNQPAPRPQTARPPDRTSSVATALPSTGTGRRHTPDTRVPSRRRSVAAATNASVVHGSGIGSHAGPNMGICRRWSISQSDSNPAASAARATARSRWRCSALPPGQSNDGTCRPKPSVTGSAAWRSRRRGRGGDRRRRGPDRVRRQQHVPTLGLDARAFLGQGPHLPGDDALRDRLVAAPVAALPFGRRHLEHDAGRRQAVAAGEREPPDAPLGVEPERVDHGGEPAPEPLGDDPLQQVERIVGGREVVDPVADERAQGVARHDLAGREVRGRPRRLARARRSHQHHQARRGQDDLGGLAHTSCRRRIRVRAIQPGRTGSQ